MTWQIINPEADEFLEQSDEEVLAYSSPDEQSDMEDDQDSQLGDGHKGRKGAADDVDEEEMGGWGSTKQDYYDADVIETEQDALDEEAEALRIQKKQLQAMSAADYGYDESEWQDGSAGDATDAKQQDRAVVTEVLPQLDITEDMGPAERLKLLRTRYPEFEPLRKELLALQAIYKDLQRKSSPSRPTLVVQQQSAAAYMASLTMYFALLTSTATETGIALSPATLRDHPVMDNLIQCRQLWEKVKDLPEDEDTEEETSDVMEDLQSEGDDDLSSHVALAEPKPRTLKKSKAHKAAEAALADAAARRADRIARAEADLVDLDALAIPTKRLSKHRKVRPDAITSIDDDESDLGEDDNLTAQELAEKAKRKKSLRFYTSQIAQKANKRGAAGRNAGGDDDIPYRERLRDRQARLNAEAENRGKREGGQRDELGQESDEEDRRQAKEIRAAADSDEEYYDLVSKKSAKKKSEKKAMADALKEAALQGGRVVEKEEVGADGKRAITYAIEKNKGLTPHRKKDVRNPRVKKRKKYDEKKKKLASMRPVYKGGEGRGGYGGELTGIKKGLVRSTKL